ncbi:MAG: plasmid pRiA4b ORF-3 family protein [Leptolyngbya sp. RL_3_1]|nr:plasmid pRiA4b ORF-3 family protein [Leptolyngbya sp. RL_3_1]
MDAHPLWHCQIELLDSEPSIWRTFQLPSDKTLAELHELAQLIMGWQNRHGYYFEIERGLVGDPPGDRPSASAAKRRYGSPDLPTTEDPAALTLGQLNLVPGTKLIYMYDVQSGWLHQLTFTERLTPTPDTSTVLCLDGAMACPPEDSGGVWGYEGLLDRLADIDEPDYEALLNSVGLDFDPNYFKVEAVNQRLQAGRPT